MALDTADKRASAVYVGSPWRNNLPFPGVMDQPDRQHLAFMYRGVSATGGGPGGPPGSTYRPFWRPRRGR